MIRLWILSDLHQEDARLRWAPTCVPEHDVVVLAGDIAGSPADAVAYAERTFDRPVVLVAGNHEFYGHALPTAIAEGRAAAARSRNVTFLEDEAAVVAGVRFVGACLWTDFALFGWRRIPEAMTLARRTFADFDQILADEPVGGAMAPRFTTKHAQDRHRQSRAFIDRNLAEPFDGSSVVVTHHAPALGSIARRFEGDLATTAFVSDLAGLVLQRRPDLWIHGHTHGRFDYRVGSTRVVCNARGFGSPTFDETLVIEV